MKSFIEYLEEKAAVAKMDDIKKILKKHGYTKLKDISSRRLAVLTNKNRSDITEKLLALFSAFGAKYTSKTTLSSAGHIELGTLALVVKPLSRQGNKSAGVDDEHTLVAVVKDYLKEVGPMDITMRAGKKRWTVKNVTGVRQVGTDTAGRKKSDVNFLVGKKEYPISIKKDNAEVWESADKYWGANAKKIIDRELKAGNIDLEKQGAGHFKIKPQMAVRPNTKEKQAVIFGSDILPRGCVATRTFRPSDFSYDGEKNLLTINCSSVITKLSEAKGDHDVWFLIRNDSTRKNKDIGYNGLRILAVFPHRINKNVLRVKR